MPRKTHKKRPKTMKEVSKGFEEFMAKRIAEGGKVHPITKEDFEKELKKAIKPAKIAKRASKPH